MLAMVAPVENGVSARTSVNQISTWTGNEDVPARVSQEYVISVESVVSRPTSKDVISMSSYQCVVSSLPLQDVILTATNENIVLKVA